MNSPTSGIRELARRLIALETPSDAQSVAGESGVARVCEKLSESLARLVGTVGYRTLISRAMAKAKSEVPALNPVQVRPDGSLEGLEELGKDDVEARVAVLAHLITLLVVFIGEPLTMALVRDAWPDAPLVITDLKGEEQQ